LECVIRQLSAQTKSTIFYKSVQLIGYADNINIMGRTKRAILEVHSELKERAKEVGLNINIGKTKAMVQSRRPRGRELLTVIDHDTEVELCTIALGHHSPYYKTYLYTINIKHIVTESVSTEINTIT
ncbi:hypothetical protein Cfor_02095, partial [Coptotermes formosanus]